MENSTIKSLTPVECPHCHQSIIIEITNNAPALTGLYTAEILQAAKQEALSKITDMNLPEEFTKGTVDWINDPNTIFSPNDIEEIIKNIQKPEDDTTEEDTTE